ncbi:Acyl-CoA dehydrogenase type 2 domain protein [Methylocella silvestris BL2]|uniref:Acyl-CoA dehydrogenase type 2 domain protein n=1 Tax=Methylocella silvestris (strain DSM 15510 / CIP 108128 / LMG 27833 / NCIMB 13906 / BL2) TaxID=395965 RepID=B8EQA2_METSB|nr:acyl-CoA dehydrogenase family protein [Methylocella silvestris]ACK51592.1 Acyl-CoA dehydrogenase type 2 domain protein [Methylocella silvestris BL2]
MYLDKIDDVDVAIAGLAHEFAQTAAAHDAAASFPFDNIARLRDVGAPGFVVPKEFGGRGFGLARAEAVVNRIARGEPSTALVLTQQYLFHATMLRSAAYPPTLRERIFHTAVGDGALINNLRVEPELGTPARGGLPATLARRTPQGWSLSGHKTFATGCPALAWHAIFARTDEPQPRVGIFVVPAGAPGLRIEESWRHLGMRASASHDVILEDVNIPEDHAAELVLAEHASGPDAFQAAWLSVLFSTVYDGVARVARDWFVGFLRDRRPANLGAPLASLPRMQEALGAIDAALYVSRALLDQHVERVDRGDTPAQQDSYYLKHAVTANALKAVSKALEVSGNPGLSQVNPLERHYRDILCARVHSPQDDSILVGGGRQALTAAGALSAN